MRSFDLPGTFGAPLFLVVREAALRRLQRLARDQIGNGLFEIIHVESLTESGRRS